MEEPMPLLPITSEATVAACASLPLRPSDVFIASYPKSGTTWMQHIVHTLVTDAASPLAHISDACPFFEVDRTWSEHESGELAPTVRENHRALGRRLFNTHLRWEMMPRQGEADAADATAAAGAKYIYLTRDGRDACVSFFHHLSHQAVEDGGYRGGFDRFVVEWSAGALPFGSWAAHLKSWLGGAAADPRVLVVSYEGMKADLRREVLRVRTHLRLPLSERRVDELLPRFTFEWMRSHEEQFNPRSVRWVASEEEEAEGHGEAPRAEPFHFIRSGQTGEGKQRFNQAQEELFAAMIRRTFPDELPPYMAGFSLR
ncbi:hypothetical protein AB1Y20_016799 [Prymnesium parvum]|uniref:Sulfotransferase domain-containing protein n=1 Tax=Prymnesium parvum TaxID=97485 RepID=A0AB34I9E1_PRYPA